ncbi:16S rRNA m(7)G-527 methyltransferase [Caloramator quimbayensis]|uniref:Ribosomal RNA small subunit methyltransferase G n=1 Tax=Caloramator quimbayensis TaxID=1147123 RepID=A0A1T4Y6J6_9CLOT|nr:16S rRNA (guanine(527)-N(7))-methyltransferase RsmG [Caloramator quimbayensis]SKA97462.1 16S rRNA m(7)G-527 methyltransferase [Caloramator quimbayensis]
MDLDELIKRGCKVYDIDIDDEKIKKFIKYKEMLKQWNEKINLTAIKEDEGIIKKHFLDSISIFSSGLIKENSYVADIGTGAGFPGIPMKIIMPSLNVLLLDSLNKRINFLNEVIKELELRDIKTMHGRAEDIAKDNEFREKFDIVTARAVANLTVLSEYCIPYVKVGGYFIAMKGPSTDEEIRESKNAIGTLGGKLNKIVDVKIYEEEMQHKLIIVEKVKSTDKKYPRKASQIEKKPLK